MYKTEKKSISAYECIKDLKNLYIEYPFLREVDSMSLRCTLFDLDNSYKSFFKENKGFPKYKSKFDKNSYRTNFVTSIYKNENIKLNLINRTITLPKLKEINIRGYRKLKQIEGRIINFTITKEITDNNDIIVTETLKLSNMLKNHKLSKSISDASFGEIIRQLIYKAKWKMKRIYQVDTFYPSS